MSVATIFVPHQDDETNLVGNILSQLTSEYEVYIVYSSIDSDAKKGSIRKKEAIAACDVYSIKKDHIIFLGYPDTPNKEGHHYFTDGNKSIVLDIEKIINRLRPELIIGTDFDFHSDHRMLSIALDEAMRKIIVGDINYRPRYLKGFCYETAYYGVDDYSATALQNTIIKSEVLGNVSYIWDDRISIQSKEPNGLIIYKNAYKALNCHKSQCAVLHARSVINSDNVFWEKRTDNQMIRAKITASSGDSSKLNDFCILDTNDIITNDSTKIDYSKGLWKLAEKCGKIDIQWEENVEIDRIIVHGNPNWNVPKMIKLSVIDDSQEIIAEINLVREYGRGTIIKFDAIITNHITINLASEEDIELSEIEAFYGESKISELSPKSVVISRRRLLLVNAIDLVVFRFIALITKVKRRIINSLLLHMKR